MPERIGAYRLESPLGRGGMGEVYLAWDERLERAVAIKRIRHDAFVQGHQRERFRREARMAARLSHAAIVQVHDLVSEESGDAIVMEYVEGPTLSERLVRGPLGIAEAVHLAKEIAEGLAAAHEAGLIHRDLKTENVVITPSGHAKILDFGLARPVSWDGEVLTQHGALVGTCYAMSPEQASGGDLDERSDLFSLGSLLYEMLAGCSAFRAKDPHATLQRVLYEQPQPLAEIRPDLPPALISLVERLLAKDRDDRPRNALSVVHKLERIERELPTEEEEWPERNDDSVSEMPTHAFPVLPASHPAVRPTSKVEGPLRRARDWMLFLAGALVALVVVVAVTFFLASNVNPADYAEFVSIRKRIESGNTRLEDELGKLERIHRSSPRFLEAKLEAVKIACNLYRSSWKASDLRRAKDYLQQARELAPKDKSTRLAEFDVALLSRNPEQVMVILDRLETSRPGDPQVRFLRYRLADAQGRQKEAEKILRDLINADSSWRYRYWLADLLSRRGRIFEARKILEELIRQDFGTTWARVGLAYLELVYGDLEKAERLYRELGDERHYLTNLGLAYSLGGRYTEALQAYESAHNLQPGQMFLTFHMADAQRNLGNTVAAEVLYGTILERRESNRAGPELFPRDEMMRALCLVHLGRFEQAKIAAGLVVRRIPDDPLVRRDASLVYSASGDLSTALFHAKAALEAGLPLRWFEDSAFAPLRQLKDFQELTAP